jgi:pyruvate/2-oxoglutarate dehydrogenase complex dihydrolipoamide dehydrogenase (E3) component
VAVPPDTEVIQDSGAFSDGPSSRLNFSQALERQEKHGVKYGYDSLITHRASYDVLIDEVWTNANRHKRRWTVKAAESAVQETIDAARYMVANGDRPSILSAQGVDAEQYLACAQEIIPLLRKRDILGFGGWCITGMKVQRSTHPSSRLELLQNKKPQPVWLWFLCQ